MKAVKAIASQVCTWNKKLEIGCDGCDLNIGRIKCSTLLDVEEAVHLAEIGKLIVITDKGRR